jgi:hypothetical protein
LNLLLLAWDAVRDIGCCGKTQVSVWFKELQAIGMGIALPAKGKRPVRLTSSPTIGALRPVSYRAALREGAAVSGVQ